MLLSFSLFNSLTDKSITSTFGLLTSNRSPLITTKSKFSSIILSIAFSNAYIQFDLTYLPGGIQDIRLMFYISYINATLDLYFYKVEDNWFEGNLTHNTQPIILSSLGYSTYSSTGVKTVMLLGSLDLYTEGNYVSFMLYPTNNITYELRIASKENTGGYQVPTLEVEYNVGTSFPNFPYILIVISLTYH